MIVFILEKKLIVGKLRKKSYSIAIVTFSDWFVGENYLIELPAERRRPFANQHMRGIDATQDFSVHKHWSIVIRRTL